MTEAQWRDIVAALQARYGKLDDALVEDGFADLADIDAEQVTAAIEALRLQRPDASAPDSAAIRREWSELALDAPPPAEAAARIREVYSRCRTARGATAGDQQALQELADENSVLGEVARAFEGPPPSSPKERRASWDALYASVVRRERKSLLLRRVPAAGLPGLKHAA